MKLRISLAVLTLLLGFGLTFELHAGVLDDENAAKTPAAAATNAYPDESTRGLAADSTNKASTDTAATDAKADDKAVTEGAKDSEKTEAQKACVQATAEAQRTGKEISEQKASDLCKKADFANNAPVGSSSKIAEAYAKPMTGAPVTEDDVQALNSMAPDDKRNLANFGGNDGGANDTYATSEELAQLGAKNANYSAGPVTADTTDLAANPGIDLMTTGAIPTDVKVADTTLTTQDQAQATLGAKPATDMLTKGQWPTSAKDRAKTTLQYLREKQLPDEVIRTTMSTIAKENITMDPCLQTLDGSTSARGIGQYTTGTWYASGGTDANRCDPKAQLDILSNDINKRYEQYQAGKLTSCAGMSFDTCNYVYHMAGGFSQKAYTNGWVQDALSKAQTKYDMSMKFYADAVAGLDGKDASTVLASMPKQTTLPGSSTFNPTAQNVINQATTPGNNPITSALNNTMGTNPYGSNPFSNLMSGFNTNSATTGTGSSNTGYSGSGSTGSSSDDSRMTKKELKGMIRDIADVCDLKNPDMKGKSREELQEKLSLMIKKCS